MPSKNTSVISARVKDSTAIKLGEMAETREITIARLIDEMVEDYEEKMTIEKGVTPIGYAVSEESDEAFLENMRYKELKLDKLVRVFEENSYPDYIVRQQVENLISQIKDYGKFNPRRGSEWQ